MNPDKIILLNKRVNFINKWNSLLRDYRDYQGYFRNDDGIKAKENADMRYYSYLMNLMEVGPYEEGKFSLEYESLESRMLENRQERKEIETRIKQLKVQIKENDKRRNN